MRVRVVLDQNLARSYNAATFSYLSSHGVEVHWAPQSYDVAHQKTITVDRDVSIIMTLNLTSQYYATTRDFAVIDRDPADVTAVETVFTNDFAGHSSSPEPPAPISSGARAPTPRSSTSSARRGTPCT